MRQSFVSFRKDDSGQLLMVGAIVISVSIILAVGLASFLPQHLTVVFSEKSHSLLHEFKIIFHKDDKMEQALNNSVKNNSGDYLTNSTGNITAINNSFSKIEENISRIEMQRGIYFEASIDGIRFNSSDNSTCGINAMVVLSQGDNKIKGNLVFEFYNCTNYYVEEVN